MASLVCGIAFRFARQSPSLRHGATTGPADTADAAHHASDRFIISPATVALILDI
ncbi:hypothetical protein GCM10009838_11830 [Catenulispora subtropica]|uniref:Uncharacterized protein n=1 Tax=Catenulispora subtropica TaxID=450798 RepID=A0ABN2QST4_9ACTN